MLFILFTYSMLAKVEVTSNKVLDNKFTQLTQTLNPDDWSDGDLNNNASTPLISNEAGNQNNGQLIKELAGQKLDVDSNSGKIVNF